MSRVGPFVGIRALDLGRSMAGAHAATILADLGAEVIAIEPSEPGSFAKSAGAPGRAYGGIDFAYNYLCRNKQCITLNLRHDKGRDIFYRLVERSDVITENFRPGLTKKWGIDYETLNAINPRIVYCSVPGFGYSGPYRDHLAWDGTIQAIAGIMSLTGEPEGEPALAGILLIDLGTAMNAAQAIMAALYHREKSGKGQLVEVSLFKTGVSFLTWFTSMCSATGRVLSPMGSSWFSIAFSGAFKTKDGYIYIGVFRPRHWEHFCQIVGREDLKDDPRFNSEQSRLKNKEELFAITRKLLKEKTTEEWLSLFDRRQIPLAPVNSIREVLTDPQVEHLGLFHEVVGAEGRRLKMVGEPFDLSEFPCLNYGSVPKVGEHTELVLHQLLGYDHDQVQALRREGVL